MIVDVYPVFTSWRDLIKDLEQSLLESAYTPEEKERVKNEEIRRFTIKWGAPNTIIPTEDAPYVKLRRRQLIKHGKQAMTLLITTQRNPLAHAKFEGVINRNGCTYYMNLTRPTWIEFLQSIEHDYGKTVSNIAKYFNYLGFFVFEGLRLNLEPMECKLTENEVDLNETIGNGNDVHTLFAEDFDNTIVIAHRVRPHNKLK